MQRHRSSIGGILIGLGINTFTSSLTYAVGESGCHAPLDESQRAVVVEQPLPIATIGQIDIQPQPIFDLTEEDTIALHRWANRFHVTTQPWIIQERLKFNKGDEVTMEDLIEAEALLRNERYIRDALVRFAPDCEPDKPAKVIVKTWDNWPIIPIINFSRRGGENRTTLGVQHDNLLGLGVRTRLRYNSDEQRTGYQLTMQSAVHLVRHANVFLNLTNNDDGRRSQLVFNKPFYHLDTERMVYAEYLHDERIDDIFQAGDTRSTIQVNEHRYLLSTGWQLTNTETMSERLSIGFADEESLFNFDPESPVNEQRLLPEDRSYQYPWVAFEYLERDIQIMSNVYLIDQPENISLGWRYRAQIGFEFNDVAEGDELGYHVLFNANKGFKWDKSLLMLDLDTRADINTTARDHVRIDANAEYFYRYSKTISGYARLSATYSENTFLDNPVVVDDRTGVRGYPLQYQHGDHRLSATLEARWFTGYNFYKLFNVGFAAFVDVGQAFDGPSEAFNETNQTLASAGIGARLFTNRASGGGVVHIDLATPFTDGESVDAWEVRVQMRRSL